MRSVFGIEQDMKLTGFSNTDSHVPALKLVSVQVQRFFQAVQSVKLYITKSLGFAIKLVFN